MFIIKILAGTIRGKKWEAPKREGEDEDTADFELDIDLGEEIELALNEASTQDMIDLAGIMGLHSMINQEQYHHAVNDKFDNEVKYSPIAVLLFFLNNHTCYTSVYICEEQSVFNSFFIIRLMRI